MRILRLNEAAAQPKVSLVLVDWSVRESFHIIDYLKRQTIPRDAFEIIIVEFYDRESPALAAYRDEVDSWILLQFPERCYYHKHLMYNAGIIAARGDIVMIGDSDAMVRETFVEAIVRTFDDTPEIALHLDQYRNNRRDLYPFDYPSFETILGDGCVNDAGGVTAGIRDVIDPLHTRNYGACMSARREDLIAIGGADEHIDFLGHICGPYDLTFRLINLGRREIWHDREFTYHSWHPGAAGVDNYQGPHDGRQMSSTSLQALSSGRTEPLVMNSAIEALRDGEEDDRRQLLARLIDPANFEQWLEDRIVDVARSPAWRMRRFDTLPAHYKGYRLAAAPEGGVRAQALMVPGRTFTAPDASRAIARIDAESPWTNRLAQRLGAGAVLAERVWEKLLRETFARSLSGS